jgi:hypothetical protein
MSEVTIGILVGISVAIASQILSYLFSRFREAQRERQLAERTAVFLLSELLHNQKIVNRLVKLTVATSYAASMRPSAEFINGLQLSLAEFKTQAYEEVFMTNWHLLKHQVFLRVNLYYYRLLQLITDLKEYAKHLVGEDKLQVQPAPGSLELGELRGLRGLGEEVRALLEEQAGKSLPASGLLTREVDWELKRSPLRKLASVARRWL